MKHLFIINPAAGGVKKALDTIRGEIIRVMAALGGDYEIYLTAGPMDAAVKIRGEARSGALLRVYACGGDGTLNECVNGAADFPHVSVTHYPCGTGNDFVKMFGAADAALFRSLAALVTGEVRTIDLIRVAGRYGINICSVGIDARIAADVHRYSRLPLIGGPAGYVVSLIVNMIKRITDRLVVSVAGIRLSGEFSLICACNGRFYGGGFNPVPDALPDDGLLDFLIIKGVTRLQLIRLIGKYAKGRYREMPDFIHHVRASRLTAEGERPLVINIDGEYASAHTLDFEVIPAGISFIFPAGMAFFDDLYPQTAIS